MYSHILVPLWERPFLWSSPAANLLFILQGPVHVPPPHHILIVQVSNDPYNSIESCSSYVIHFIFLLFAFYVYEKEYEQLLGIVSDLIFPQYFIRNILNTQQS